MMRLNHLTTVSKRFVAFVAAVAVVACAGTANARPVYFDTFTALYGFSEGDDLYACGVCHFQWDGAGARNPFGNSVEQQLYVGKTISQALMDVEGDDADGDTFTNLDEIMNFMTLPGFNCTNFQEAIGAPLGYDTYITPLVPSCLEPLDIRVTPDSIAMATFAGTPVTTDVTIINNGTTTPVDVSSYGFLTGSAVVSVSGPAAPFSIPVGNSVVLEITFDPVTTIFVNDTLRIESNDPDENPVDIPFTAIGSVLILAPSGLRSDCFNQINKAYRKYTKTQQRLWADCYVDEVAGRACNTGNRDLRLENAEIKLRTVMGGSKDKACSPLGITPSTLGAGLTCGAPCGTIALGSFDDFADCLVCQADAARDTSLAATVGTIPPDLPANTAGSLGAASCQNRLASTVTKSAGKIQKTLASCEIDNVTASVPVDCAVEHADSITKATTKADNALLKCSDTTGLAGCSFEMMPDPMCLGNTALATGQGLVNATLGLDP